MTQPLGRNAENTVSKSSHPWTLLNNIAVFVVFVAGFTVWRYGKPLVWDDTNIFKIALESRLNDRTPETHIELFIRAFRELSPHGYRPMASILVSTFTSLIDSIFPTLGHLLFVACFIGGLAVAFKGVAAHFIESHLLVYFCVILFMFSSAFVSSSWISYCGIPALVPFFTCISLLLYFQILDRPKRKWLPSLFLFLVVFFGTWYREFMIAVPMTIVGMELVRTRRLTKISLLSGLLILHCLFPTFVVHLFFPELPIRPVFRLGYVSQQMTGVSTIREEVSRHLFNIPSPSLLVLSFLAFMGLLLGNRAERKVPTGSLALMTGLASLVGIIFFDTTWPYHLAVVTLILIAWFLDPRLALWTAVFLGPFYRVFTEQVHLAYVMMPVSIVLGALLERCWSESSKCRTLFHFAVGIAITVGTIDSFANWAAVRIVMGQIAEGIAIVGQKLNERAGERPVAIIGNAVHVDDLRLYLKGNYQILWTVGKGHDRPGDAIETSQQLSKFLMSKLPTTEVYFLDVHHDYPARKKSYHQHRFVASCSVNTEDLGELNRTRVDYFMPDPLRRFGNREFVSFLGPPDLENDFYRGRSDRKFFRRVEAQYHLYRVVSDQVKDWLALDDVHLIEKDFLKFSITTQNGRFFAIPVGEGAFSFKRICDSNYSRSFESSTLSELKDNIRNAGTVDSKLRKRK